MSWKNKKRKNQARNNSRQHPRDRGHWPVGRKQRSKSKPITAELLSFTAPVIEAAGSLQRAVELNAIHMDSETLEQLRKALPVSRGGEVRHPDAVGDWMKIVNKAVQDREVDLDSMRAMFASISNNN